MLGESEMKENVEKTKVEFETEKRGREVVDVKGF